MSLSDYNMHSPNMVCICVDRRSNGDYVGQIWHQYSSAPIPFETMVELMQELDGLYDRWDFPQRATNARSFDGHFHRMPALERDRERESMDERRLSDRTGAMGTFLVRVKYRQNASWQGEVVWVEKNKRQYFRSALELLKLMDSALDEGNAAEPADCALDEGNAAKAADCALDEGNATKAADSALDEGNAAEPADCTLDEGNAAEPADCVPAEGNLTKTADISGG